MKSYPANAVNKSLVLEVGKTYKRECGAVVTVTRIHDNNTYSAKLIVPSSVINQKGIDVTLMPNYVSYEEYNLKAENFNSLYDKLSG